MAAVEHSFQPITTEANFKDALDYIATKALELGKLATGRELPLDTLAIFAHSDQELNFLSELIKKYGPVSALTHGKTLYIEPADLRLREQKINYLGVRAPDPTRPEVGYADFPVDDLDAIRKLIADNDFIKPAQSGAGEQMLEIRYPDFDIRGYIIAE